MVPMRLVVQRVKKGSVSVLRQAQDKNSKVVGKIGEGLFVLVGLAGGDTEKDAEVWPRNWRN